MCNCCTISYLSPSFPANSHIRFARALFSFCTAEVVATKDKNQRRASNKATRHVVGWREEGAKDGNREKVRRGGECEEWSKRGGSARRRRLNIERASGAGERALEESKEAAKQKF